ncbi:MAG: hypothetical protein U0414_40585 [Polyangiaceae bacterium]
MLGKVPKTDVRVIEECSAVDGTWGMKAAHFATGRRYAQKLARGVADAAPDVVVTDCTLSALRISDEARRRAPDASSAEAGASALPRVMHPIEALAEAYGLGDAGSTTGLVPGA